MAAVIGRIVLSALLVLSILSFFSPTTAASATQVVAIAGGGAGDLAPVGNTTAVDPHDVSVAPDGSVFFISNFRVRRILEEGRTVTVAGNGFNIFSVGSYSDGASATAVSLFPTRVAADALGNLFIISRDRSLLWVDAAGIIRTLTAVSESGMDIVADGTGGVYVATSNRVVRVTTDNTATVVAGTGSSGFSGDGGPATAATLNNIEGLLVAPDGDLFISDFGNGRIRRVDASGTITTFAGGGQFQSDGVSPNQASIRPMDLTASPDGDIFFIDGSLKIRKVDAQADVVITVAGTGLVGDYAEGSPAIGSNLLTRGIGFSGTKLYFSDVLGFRIGVVDELGILSTAVGRRRVCCYAGDGGAPLEAAFDTPWAIKARGSSVLVADRINGRIREVSASSVETIASGFGQLNGVDYDSAGNLYVSDRGGVYKIDPSGSRTRLISGHVRGVAVGPSDEVFFAGNHAVYRIDGIDSATRVAGTGSLFVQPGTGGWDLPATSAHLGNLADVYVDDNGILYISDDFRKVSKIVDGIIRRVHTGGVSLSTTRGLTARPDGTVFVAGGGGVYAIDDNGIASILVARTSNVPSTDIALALDVALGPDGSLLISGSDNTDDSGSSPGGVRSPEYNRVFRLQLNRAPLAQPDDVVVDEDGSISFDVLTNDSDPDGDALAVSAHSSPAHGILALNGGVFTYTPSPNFNGSDSFSYTVSDGKGASATSTVDITVVSVNDAPDAADDLATTIPGQAVTIAVLGNDVDVDGDNLAVVSITQPEKGVATINGDGTITYAGTKPGTFTFIYTVSDPHGGTDQAAVTVTVSKP